MEEKKGRRKRSIHNYASCCSSASPTYCLLLTNFTHTMLCCPSSLLFRFLFYLLATTDPERQRPYNIAYYFSVSYDQISSSSRKCPITHQTIANSSSNLYEHQRPRDIKKTDKRLFYFTADNKLMNQHTQHCPLCLKQTIRHSK